MGEQLIRGDRFAQRVIFEKQGGGTTSHFGCKTYVDLIVGNLGEAANDHGQVVDLFRAFSRHSQGEANFGYAELATDDRLRDALCKTAAGCKFYSKLTETIPLLSVSSDILGNPDNIKNVKIFPLRDLNNNPIVFLNKLYVASAEGSPSKGSYVVEKVDYLNKIISLKPGAFGLSINVNTLIQVWIDKKRRDRKKK